MPHCIIEITKNILPYCDFEKIMKDVSIALNNIGCFETDDIKIRIRPIEISYMGIEIQEHSYVATDIQLLNNKTENQLNYINDSVHNAILSNFEKLIGKSSITTKITLLNVNLYKRTVNYRIEKK